MKPETVKVTRTDGTSNRFVIEEERNDGAIVLRPDTSYEATMERAPGRAMTSDEFERLIALTRFHPTAKAEPSMPTDPVFPVRFDPDALDDDLLHVTPRGRQTAGQARTELEPDGIPCCGPAAEHTKSTEGWAAAPPRPRRRAAGARVARRA